jgi:peroxiredoxin (alkyl hydroperoxide reductase subunit C)
LLGRRAFLFHAIKNKRNERKEKTMARVGQRIEDFDFEVYHNDKIDKVKFSDFKGKWLVLLFYPADFTFVCPTELEDAAENYGEFKKEGAEIISFSTDTVYVHKAWHDQSTAIKKISYPMGADPAGKICRYFGTYMEDEGLSLRGSFIVDPDGILKTIEIHDNSIGRSAEEILRKLQAANFVRGHEGEVCPANWRPGKKTLRPGLDLVGKI